MNKVSLPKTQLRTQNKWACLAAHIFALFIGAGLIVNWTPFHAYFKEQGIYNWKCDSGEESCIAQETALSCLPIYGLSASFSCAILGGLIRDRFGSKTAHVVSMCLISTSMLLMKLGVYLQMNGYSFDLLPIAFMIWGASGEIITISVIGISELFPNRQSFILTVIASVRSIFVLMTEVIRRFNPSFSVFTIGYAIIALTWMVFFVNSNYFAHDTFNPFLNSGASSTGKKRFLLSEQNYVSHHIPRMKYASLIAYYMVFTIIFNYIVAVMPLVYRDDENMLIEIGLMLPMSGVIGAPLMGWIADHFGTFTVPSIEVLTAILILTTSQIPLSSFAQIVNLLSMMMYYGCPSGQVYLLVCDHYPVSVHGSLSGFTFLCGGISSLFSSALIHLINSNDDASELMFDLHGAMGFILIALLVFLGWNFALPVDMIANSPRSVRGDKNLDVPLIFLEREESLENLDPSLK